VVQAFIDRTIPRNTPFTLTGSATDPDDDPLTYLWEPFDRSGVQASLSEPDDGRMPLFRVFRPTPVPTRTFPKMETIVSGIADKTEKLPQMARTMNFRLVARDGKGGVAYGTQRIIVDGGSGPLRVTAPAAGATVPSGSLNVTWDVAGTNLLPGAANVDIFLSTDGGLTFNPQPLLTGTTNKGDAVVTLPGTATERARIMVKASENIFFAVSAGDFKITGNGGALSVSPTAGFVSSGDEGGPFQNGSAVYTLKNTGTEEIDWTATKGATWLDVSPALGKLEADAETEVIVSINAATAKALARNHYQDAVAFTNTTNGAGTTSRPALLIVGQTLKDGIIVLEADGLYAWGFTGGPFSPPSKAFTIHNLGMSQASWTATQTADWVTLSASEGTLGAGESATITATVNGAAAGKANGAHTSTITFYRTLVQGSELLATRPLTLTVAAPAAMATLAMAPAEGLSATGYVGGPFAPTGKNFTLRNVGETNLAWTATKTAGWLALAPTVGTLAKGESSIVTAFINSNAAALTAGIHNDTVTFTNTTDGAGGAGNTTRPVSLSIATGPGVLSVTPAAAFDFSGPRGGPFAPAVGVACTLKNTGGAAIDWTIDALESWLEMAPQTGTLAAGTSVTVTISAADMARALIPGAHRNTLYFSNKTSGAGNMTLPGGITVTATPAAGPLTVLPAPGYTVTGDKGGPFTPPASFPFTLRNTGDNALDWEYMGDAGWANVPESTKGALAAGADTTFTMEINTNANLLSSNNYRGAVYFIDKTHKMTISRHIDLKVKGPGDITGDGAVNLADVVTAMQVQAGKATPAVRSDYAASGADVNGDDKVGHHEAVYTMQAAANLRTTPPPYFILKSDAFRDEQPIPLKYMVHGLSPPLSWSNAPAGTKSFVLIVEDPDELPALGATKNYWIVYDIPADVTAMAEGAGAKTGDDGKNKLPTGAKHGTTSWDKHNTYYHGLEPTANTGPHRFIFRLFALSSATIAPSGGTTQDKIEAAMNGKVLGICELMGMAVRP
jgi:Raf kinase inhibitor-like YbhB/YbcL family protein